MNEELYELENFKGSGFSNFLKDQSKNLLKKQQVVQLKKL